MKKTTQEYIKLIGSTAIYNINNLKLKVKITCVKQVFGRTDALIEPLAGEGETWVNIDNLIIS